jgi:hypothetical protein
MIRLYKYGSKTDYTDFPDYLFSKSNYGVFNFPELKIRIEETDYSLPPEFLNGVSITTGNTSSTVLPSDDDFTIVEELDTGITYMGLALAGCTGTAEAKYRIKQIIKTGLQTFVLWANGNKAFDKVWDNRAAYTYSFIL